MLEDYESILVEVEGETDGLAPIGDSSGVVGQASQQFEQAVSALKPIADSFISKLKSAVNPPDEIKVDMDLKLTGKGHLVIASGEGSASFKVSLLWRRPKDE